MKKDQFEKVYKLADKYPLKNKVGIITGTLVKETVTKMKDEIEALNSFEEFINSSPYSKGDVLILKDSGEKVLYQSVLWNYNDSGEAIYDSVNVTNCYGEKINVKLDKITIYDFTSQTLMGK